MDMRNKKSTLENFNYNHRRIIGNSTRQVDEAIQSLFNGFIVVCEDHHQEGRNRNANKNLFGRIIRRIASEHPTDYPHLKWNTETFEVWLDDKFIHYSDLEGRVILNNI